MLKLLVNQSKVPIECLCQEYQTLIRYTPSSISRRHFKNGGEYELAGGDYEQALKKLHYGLVHRCKQIPVAWIII